MLSFTDTHAHIHFETDFAEINNIIKNAKENNINRLITVGISVKDSIRALEIANKFENVYSSVGIHPQDCGDYTNDDYNKLFELCKNKKVIAIGEIGLDYFREYVEKDRQKEVFRNMLKLSLEVKKPVIIHNREANRDCLDIMDKYLGGGKANGGIFHCFSGGKDVIKWAIDNNFYISYAGQVTYKSASDLKDTLKYVPKDRLLIETDSPYLAPVPKRGKKNEPSYCIYTAEFISKEINISIEKLSEVTESNFNTLFGEQL